MCCIVCVKLASRRASASFVAALPIDSLSLDLASPVAWACVREKYIEELGCKSTHG